MLNKREYQENLLHLWDFFEDLEKLLNIDELDKTICKTSMKIVGDVARYEGIDTKERRIRF